MDVFYSWVVWSQLTSACSVLALISQPQTNSAIARIYALTSTFGSVNVSSLSIALSAHDLVILCIIIDKSVSKLKERNKSREKTQGKRPVSRPSQKHGQQIFSLAVHVVLCCPRKVTKLVAQVKNL